MSNLVQDETQIRNMPPEERFQKCSSIIRTENDESKRWDAVWLAGEIAETEGPQTPIFDRVADLMQWVLENDDNGVVKHEACFQIAARNMRQKIPNLTNSALNDKSGLVKHEALESLGLMRAFESEELISQALDDPNPDVKETAAFVLKRFARLKNAKSKYVPSQIL